MKKIVILLSLVLTACSFGSGFRIGPPDSAFLMKNGVQNQVDNIRAQKECGFYMGVADYDINERARAYLCLESAGYFLPDDNGLTYCQRGWRKDLPACQPGAVIPKPDPFKASEYCQNYPSRPECRP